MNFSTPFVEITTSSFCSVDCSFCPQKLFLSRYPKISKDNVRLMSMDTFKKIVSWAPPKFQIFFSGFSEPFMNPRCTEMILYAHKSNRSIRLFSTLMGASLKDFKKIANTLSFSEGRDSLSIHLPSSDGTEHIVISDHYIEMLRFILSIEGESIDFHYHGKDLHDEVKKIVLSSDRKAYFVDLITRAGNVDILNKPFPKKLRGSIRCLRLDMHEHTVLPDGTVVLCCNDFGMKHILGNIHVDDYEAVRSSKEMKKVLRGQDDESMDILCRKCHFAVDKDALTTSSNVPFSASKKRKYVEMYKKFSKVRG